MRLLALAISLLLAACSQGDAKQNAPNDKDFHHSTGSGRM